MTNRIAELTKELEHAHKDIGDKDLKIREHEEEIMMIKSQLLEHEKKINILSQQNDLYDLKVLTKNDNLDMQRVTIEVLEKQINAITEALSHNDQEVQRLLGDKSRLVNAKFLEFMNTDMKFKEIKLPDYFKHSFNFNYESFYDQVPKTTFLNPNYNDNPYLSPQKRMVSEDFQGTIESKINERDAEDGLIEDDKIPDEKVSILDKNTHSERVSQLERGIMPARKSSTINRDSFITGLDLENAFNNAENVINKECYLL